MIQLKQKYGLLIIGISIGIVYGLVTRFVFGEAATLASITYLFIVPAILGIIPLLFADQDKLRSYRNIIFIPWLTVSTFFLIMFLGKIEDIICLLILAAPFFILGTIGALIFTFTQINREKNKNKLLFIFFLPFILSPIESLFQHPSNTYEVSNMVIINAASKVIWENIVEVYTIDKEEYELGFFNKIGIPRPINASVSQRELGGSRVGNFEGGLKFVETITEYNKEKKISFDINVDPLTIRKKVFDQHVLRGNYFSFINATYELTTLKNGQVRLKLSSRYRLTSSVNFYGKFWGDLILSDFQGRLLKVIEKRCEN